VSAIPRILHVVFGMRPQQEPFSPVHYAAVESARSHLEIETVMVHCWQLPYGMYWDLLRPSITLRRVEPLAEVDGRSTFEPLVSQYLYAHHADVIRLDALIEHGGVYLDLDTVTLRPFPERWWSESFVIGEERGVGPGGSEGKPSLLNAVMMSEPDSSFASRWRAQIIQRMDGSWSAHSCQLAAELAAQFPGEVLVVPPVAFASFNPTIEGMCALLLDPPRSTLHQPSRSEVDSDEIEPCVLHLCAHLWWSEGRNDFLTLSGPDLHETWFRTSPSVYATAARAWLPALDLP
jgi:hypothetical protein